MKLVDIKILEEPKKFIYATNIDQNTEGIIIAFADDEPVGYVTYNSFKSNWIYTCAISSDIPVDSDYNLQRLLKNAIEYLGVTKFKLLKF